VKTLDSLEDTHEAAGTVLALADLLTLIDETDDRAFNDFHRAGLESALRSVAIHQASILERLVKQAREVSHG